jgi:hypothetical protein
MGVIAANPACAGSGALDLVAVLPLNTATWALGGFYASLAPSLVRTATGSTSNLIGGATVAVLTLTGALMIFILRNGLPAGHCSWGRFVGNGGCPDSPGAHGASLRCSSLARWSPVVALEPVSSALCAASCRWLCPMSAPV